MEDVQVVVLVLGTALLAFVLVLWARRSLLPWVADEGTLPFTDEDNKTQSHPAGWRTDERARHSWLDRK